MNRLGRMWPSQPERRLTRGEKLGGLADVLVASQSYALQCESKLGPKRQGEHDAILARLTHSLMRDPELRVGDGLPIPPLLQLISGYAIERYAASFGNLANMTDMARGSRGELWMLRRNADYLDARIYRLDSDADYVRVSLTHFDLGGEWLRTLCVAPSRLFFIPSASAGDSHCLRMVENGAVTTVAKIDRANHDPHRMVYSPEGSRDGTIIFSDLVRDRIMKVNVAEKQLIATPIYEDQELEVIIGDSLFWNTSPDVTPFTVLYFTPEFTTGDKSTIASINVNTGELKTLPFRNDKKLLITDATCTSSGSIILSTLHNFASQILSIDHVTGFVTVIAGSDWPTDGLPPKIVPNSDPLSETPLRQVTSLAYLPDEFAVAVSDGQTIFKIPLPAHLCLCCTPST